MREPVTQITLRVPTECRASLDQMCLELGVTRRALFEAALTVALEDENDPIWAPLLTELWGAARRLEESGDIQARPRDKLIVHLSPELADRFREACRWRGVSQTAALALMVMPRPEKDGEEYGRYRDHAMARLVPLARQLDYQRRRR